MRVEHITVVVPAHNEAAQIQTCLDSLARAVAQVQLPVQVIVVLDACTDGTREVIRGQADAVAVDVRNVGSARAAGFRCAQRSAGSWYATTDADSRVPTDWLAVQVESARRHDVFVGTIQVQDWSLRHSGLQPEYERSYVHAAGHRHVHGTNVGLSAETYWAVGGFAPLPAHEDVTLVEACRAWGAVLDWSAQAPVVTSARHSDRTPHGFASYLTELEGTLPA